MEGSQGWGLGGSRSVSSAESFRSALEIEEESPPVVVEEDKVFVALKADFKEGKANLFWAIQQFTGSQTFVLAHVHRPAKMIPMLGGKFPASSLREDQVRAYRLWEREKMNKALDEYLTIFSRLKVRVQKEVIEMEDVTKGLIELIVQQGITKLVMGAAADNRYSKRMREPKSKTANAVKQKADPSCKIWFVCKGNLICIREASLNASRMAQSPMTSPSSELSIQSEQFRSRALLSRQIDSFDLQENRMHDFDSGKGRSMLSLPPVMPVRTRNPQILLSLQGSSTDPWEGTSRSSQSSGRSSFANEEMISHSGTLSLPKDEESEAESVILPLPSEEPLQFSSARQYMEDLGLDDDIYNKLQEAIKEAENLKNEAYEECCRRRKAEIDAVLAHQKAKASESMYSKEMRHRKEVEETLEKEKLELEQVKDQYSVISEQLQMALEEKLELELQIAESDRTAKDFEEKLSEARNILRSLQVEYDLLQQDRDNVVKEAEDIRQERKQTDESTSRAFSLEFSYLELSRATQNFSNLLKIGEGGFGTVYKGVLRNTTVAIKLLHPHSLQGQTEFYQEVAVLSRVRHPNLVTLIGACSEALGLVYEFLPNGSLEDRLACVNHSPPLTWQVRTRIIGEICSAVIFLHSNKPHPVVHGDLKPDNILLDANFISKLGDFGICRLLIHSKTSTTLYRNTHPKGSLAYIDPEFLTTGELTPCSDTYSFGIIILRLLTGLPAIGIAGKLKEALDNDYFDAMIDPTAGDWPFVQAKQLAHLGLRCCEMSRKSRPDLGGEVWRVVEPMMKAASSSTSPPSFGPGSDDNSRIPSYFICPIFQEIMIDPHIAADGFTYEAEAIKGWIDGGHDTSPMTNLKLQHCNLVPNRALRSAIQEWLQQEQLQQQPH